MPAERWVKKLIDIDENYIYISHLGDNLKFWRLPTSPESISDRMSSQFTPTNALGRTAPVYTYSNSGPRVVQIDLELHRDMMDDVNMGWSNSELGTGEDYIDNLIRALQSISVPKINLTNKLVEPPLCAIRLSNQIFIKGVVTGDIGLTYKLPLLSNGKYAQVRLSLVISEIDPYDATEVYKNGSFRGVVNSLRTGMHL